MVMYSNVKTCYPVSFSCNTKYTQCNATEKLGSCLLFKFFLRCICQSGSLKYLCIPESKKQHLNFVLFCFRLPHDIDNQRSPTSPLPGPTNDDRPSGTRRSPPPPSGPQPSVPRPHRLRISRGLRPQNGRRKLSSTYLPFPQTMLWHYRYN